MAPDCRIRTNCAYSSDFIAATLVPREVPASDCPSFGKSPNDMVADCPSTPNPALADFESILPPHDFRALSGFAPT